MKAKRKGLSRRSAFGAFALAAAAPGAAGAAPAAAGPTFTPDYPRQPLRAATVRALIVQTPDNAIDPATAAAGRAANLSAMLDRLSRSATSFDPPADLISFHEMPLHGFGEWTRAEALKAAIEAPGAETAAIGKKAREINAYVSFGAYVRDPDWPGHVIMMGLLVGPDGNLAARHWKARGSLAGLGLFTSTVYECLERYVEMYGWDEVIPVARTPIGNICLSGVQNDPMLYMAMGLKGAEILCRFATGAMPLDDAAVMGRAINAFTVFANSAQAPGHRYYLNGVGVGQSAILGPDGRVMAQAGAGEGAIRATLAIADLRAARRPPDFQWPLYRTLFESYRPRFDPGWFLKVLPQSWAETRSFFKSRTNW